MYTLGFVMFGCPQTRRRRFRRPRRRPVNAFPPPRARTPGSQGITRDLCSARSTGRRVADSRAAPSSRPKRSRRRGGARLEACGQQVRVRPERLGPVMTTTCRSPPAVRRGRGPVRGSPQEPLILFPVGFQVEGPAASGFERCRARPFVAADLAAVLATVPRTYPRPRPRVAAALESDQGAGRPRAAATSVLPKWRRHGSAFSVS